MATAIGEEELGRGEKMLINGECEDPRELSSRDVWVHIPCKVR